MNPFRRPLIAGNWKMHAGGRDACPLARAVADRAKPAERVDVVIAPPFTAIAAVAQEVFDARGSVDVDEGRGVGVAAQNLHASSSGAFTGEISSPMLRDAGATWVIVGHSERRQLFGETDEGVAAKVRAALEHELRPIACVGETLAEREAGATLEVVERQTRAFMKHLGDAPGRGVIAYEPVWAIGTGKVASPADAQTVHAYIRSLLEEVSEELAETTRILYGGSVKGDNAAGLLSMDDVDGALVGGASLDAEGFGKIIDAAQALAQKAAEEVEGAAAAASSPQGDEDDEDDGPDSDGPDSDGPDSDGPDSDGPDSDGPDSDGPDSDGPDSDGPDSDGPDSDGEEKDGEEKDGEEKDDEEKDDDSDDEDDEDEDDDSDDEDDEDEDDDSDDEDDEDEDDDSDDEDEDEDDDPDSDDEPEAPENDEKA